MCEMKHGEWRKFAKGDDVPTWLFTAENCKSVTFLLNASVHRLPKDADREYEIHSQAGIQCVGIGLPITITGQGRGVRLVGFDVSIGGVPDERQ